MERFGASTMEEHQIPMNSDVMKHSTFMNKAYVREIMLQHEKTFKEQVHDLHKLYEVQKALMRKAKLGESAILLNSTQSTDANVIHSLPDENLKHKNNFGSIDEARRGPNKNTTTSTRKKVIDLEQLPEDDTDDELDKPENDVNGSREETISCDSTLFYSNSNFGIHNNPLQSVQGSKVPPNLDEKPLDFGGMNRQTNTAMVAQPQHNHEGAMSRAIGKETHWVIQGSDGSTRALGRHALLQQEEEKLASFHKASHEDSNVVFSTTSGVDVLSAKVQHQEHETNIWYPQKDVAAPMPERQHCFPNGNHTGAGWLLPPLQNTTHRSLYPQQAVYGLHANMNSFIGNNNSSSPPISQKLTVQKPPNIMLKSSDSDGVHLKPMASPQEGCKEEEINDAKMKDEEGNNVMAIHMPTSPSMPEARRGLKPSLQQVSVSGACLTNGALEEFNEDMLSGSSRKDDAIGPQTKKPQLSRQRPASDLSTSSQVTMQAVSMQSSSTEVLGNVIKQERECSSKTFDSNAMSRKASNSTIRKRKSMAMATSDNDDATYNDNDGDGDDNISGIDNLAASILLSFTQRPPPMKKRRVECSKLVNECANKYPKANGNNGVRLCPRDQSTDIESSDSGHVGSKTTKVECGIRRRGVSPEKERTRRRETNNGAISAIAKVDVHTLPRGRQSSRGPLVVGRDVHETNGKEHSEHCDGDGEQGSQGTNARRRKQSIDTPDKFEVCVKDNAWKGADRKKSRSRLPVAQTPKVPFKKAQR